MTPEGPGFPAVPTLLRGVWRRTLLEGPGIPPDTRTQVFWIQTRHWHGDLRIPADRPDFSGCADLAACSPEQRAWLDRQRGFAGVTEVCGAEGGIPEGLDAPVDGLPTCQWHRRVDYQPPSGARDIGTLAFSRDLDTLEEFGVDAEYHETWVRVAASRGSQSVWHRSSGAAGRHDDLLLISGACFFLLRDSTAAAPGSAGDGVLDSAGRLQLELSYGHWDGDRGCGSIQLSTLPWRQGAQVTRGADWQPLDPEETA